MALPKTFPAHDFGACTQSFLYITEMRYPFTSKINDGISDKRETVKSLEFTTFGLKKFSTIKYSPYETLSKFKFKNFFSKVDSIH
jgi:hypothetical protein